MADEELRPYPFGGVGPELRADAEYVRDHHGYEDSFGPVADGEFLEAAKRLADHYLAQPGAGGTMGDEELRAAAERLLADAYEISAFKGQKRKDEAMLARAYAKIIAARPAAGGAGEAARAERDKLRAVLRRIQQWDCLNPPDRNLCHDHPWLRRLVDVALGDDTTARIGPGGDLVSDR